MDVRELFEKKDELLGKTVTLSGWVRNHRKQKEFGFIDFSDGTCFKHLQLVYKDKLDVLDFMYLIDKKLVQSDDFDGTSFILGHNENYKGVAGYFNNYYIYADSYSPLPYTTLCFINFALSKFDGFKSLANEPFFYTPNNLIREEITDYYAAQRKSDNIEDRGYTWWKNNKQVITKDENQVKKLLDELDKIMPEGGVG